MLLAPLALLAGSDSCSGSTTPEVNACLSRQAASADTELARYLAAARRQVAQNGGPAPATSADALRTGFDAAQAAWTRYRTAMCDNVFDAWSGGTIRTAQALQCRIDLTRERTHMVWQTYLTYPDSTPPVLPEPASGR